MKQWNNEAIEQSILKTLVYADLFGWPVTENEIFRKFSIFNFQFSMNFQLKNILKKLIGEKKIECQNRYYFIYSRKGLVERRIQREKWAREKLVIAKKAVGWLKIIPSILLVGVSGGLAAGNVGEDDDIDFFIICRMGSLWTTRFLATVLLDILGQRRQPNDKNFKNKICLNMFVDEEGMAVPKPEQDVYTAHEVGQMKPLWERNGSYQRFLRANKWVVSCHSDPARWREKNLGPIRSDRIYASLDPSPSTPSTPLRTSPLGIRMTEVEKFFRWLQLKYMGKKRTSEKIEPHRLMFHPEDKRKWVLREYQKRLTKLKL